MTQRYDARRDRLGWSVFDCRTGALVVLANAGQAGLSWMDADDLAERLNRRRLDGGRGILP
jgi:hypothetical protein